MFRAAQETLRRALPGWSDPEFDSYAQRHYPAYWLKVEPERQVAHAKLLHAMATDLRSLATEVTVDTFHGVTAITVVAPDHPRLLSGIAGACAAAGANIVDAQIFTTADGLALDTIFVSRAFEQDEDELRRGRRIATNIEKTARGEIRLAEIAPAKEARDVRHGAFAIEPEVTIDNTLSGRYTVVEVSGLDRPGLLRDLTSSLSRLNLNIGSAHIVTFGEKAVDAFYITDLTGQKINSRGQAGRHQTAPAGGLRGRTLTVQVAFAGRAQLDFCGASADMRAKIRWGSRDDDRHERRTRSCDGRSGRARAKRRSATLSL